MSVKNRNFRLLGGLPGRGGTTGSGSVGVSAKKKKQDRVVPYFTIALADFYPVPTSDLYEAPWRRLMSA